MKQTKGDLKALLPAIGKLLGKVRPYGYVLIFILFAAIYGLMVLTISTLSSSPVDETEVTAQVKASPSLSIDKNAITQLESLKDNSVNVQTLFESSRTNPFNE